MGDMQIDIGIGEQDRKQIAAGLSAAHASGMVHKC